MSESSAAYKGLPLKDREEADIRAALKERDEEVVAAGIRLWAYARKENLGISPLAHQTGISTSALSGFINGSYVGDFNEVAARIGKFFWRLEQKEQYGDIRQFAETALAQALWALFEKTRIVRRIQIVQGPEQIGKTRAAVEYTQRNNHGRTVYTKLAGGTRSGCGDFIWGFAEAVGVPYTIKLREKRIRIKQAIETCDLVIIDEAHLAFTWSDSSQAEFWDYLRTDIFSDGDRGIVLMATNSEMLKGLQKWRARTRYNVGQLLGRMRNEVMTIDPAEDIIEADVRLLVKRYYDPGRAVINRLHDIATKDQLGHYGLILDIMNESWTKAKARKTKLTDDIVLKTSEDIMSTLKSRKDLYE
jgi:DNA transposition AAA+ family ATPase